MLKRQSIKFCGVIMEELKESTDGDTRTWLDHQLAMARSLRPEMSDLYIGKEDPYSVEIHHGNKNISRAFKSILADDIQTVWNWAYRNPEIAMSPVRLEKQPN